MQIEREVVFASVSSIIVIVALTLSAKPQDPSTLLPKNATRCATRQQRTIQLHPSDIRFQIPQDWLKWHSQFRNNLHLTPKELRRIQVGAGEWDSEYSRVVNAALPFDDCAAHVGGEGWGTESRSFGDLQVRAYVSNLSSREILERIKDPGFSEAKTIAKLEGGRTGNEAHISTSSEKDWQRTTITYPLWFHDYGGTAMIDFYVKEASPYWLVLVFMEIGGRTEEKASILDSVMLAAK